MPKTTFSTLLTSVALWAFAGQGIADGLCSEDAMLVFDGSGSMAEQTWATSTTSRMKDARHAVRAALPEVTPFRDVGLLVYGPGGRDGCSGINVAFGPSEDAAEAIIETVEDVIPNGLTPLAASVERAAIAMDYQREPAIIVVVTDGYETCGGSPCTMAKTLSDESAGLQIHVIGFNLPNRTNGWKDPNAGEIMVQDAGARCLADNTGGLYVATKTVDELVTALNATLGCMLVARGTGEAMLPG